MANELHAVAETDLILTATLVRGSAAINAGFMVESASIPGFYTGSVPGGTPAGVYSVLIGTNDLILATGTLHWDGGAEIGFADVNVPIQDLHLIHGLRPGAPLVVNEGLRQAGPITQAIALDGMATTVTRQ